MNTRYTILVAITVLTSNKHLMRYVCQQYGVWTSDLTAIVSTVFSPHTCRQKLHRHLPHCNVYFSEFTFNNSLATN